MFSKTNLLSTLAAAVWAYLGGYLLWGMLTVDFFNDHLGSATGVMREIPDMFHLIVGCFIVAFTLSTIYGKWANSKYGAGSGFIFGFWIAIFIGLGEGLINYSTTNVTDITAALVNALICIVFYGIMGLIIGLVYSKTTSKHINV